MNRFYLKVFLGFLFVFVVLCLVKMWNNYEYRESVQVIKEQDINNPEPDTKRVADACGVIRSAFIGSSNSTWNFKDCSAVSADHMVVTVWSPVEVTADTKVETYTSDRLPAAMSVTMCDLFFRSFDFIQKVDFTVAGADKSNAIKVFNLDRSVCGAGLNSKKL